MLLNEIHYKLSLNFITLFQNFCFIEVVYVVSVLQDLGVRRKTGLKSSVV
jgi:hypothetical protein